jgi:hypothetical protein
MNVVHLTINNLSLGYIMKVNEIIVENPVGAAIGRGLAKGASWAANKIRQRATTTAAQKYRQDLLKNRLKKAAADKKARAAAQAAIKASPFIKLLEITGAVLLAIDYRSAVKYFEEQYNMEVSNAGSSDIYKHTEGNKEEAYRLYRSDADHALGEFIAKSMLLLKPGVPFSILQKIMSMPIIRSLPWMGAASKTLIPAIKTWISSSKTGAASRIAIAAWLETEAGKEFLAKGLIVGPALEFTGTVGRSILDQVTGLLKEYDGFAASFVNSAGKAVASATGSNTTQPETPADPAAANNSTDTPQLMARSQGKVLWVNNVQITGTDGYILPGLERYVDQIRDLAQSKNRPDPTAGLKPRP